MKKRGEITVFLSLVFLLLLTLVSHGLCCEPV